MRTILILLLALTACTTPPAPTEDPPTGKSIAQASEQCHAQPELDWC